jgi:hypothetical protein
MRHITKGPEPAELCAYGGAQGTTYDIGSCSSPAHSSMGNAAWRARPSCKAQKGV